MEYLFTIFQGIIITILFIMMFVMLWGMVGINHIINLEKEIKNDKQGID